jgi:hypothetical protein
VAPLTDTHGVCGVTVQVQSRAAVTVIVPEPPAASNDDGALVASTWHLSLDGADTFVVDEVQFTDSADSNDAMAAATDGVRLLRRINSRWLMHGGGQRARRGSPVLL